MRTPLRANAPTILYKQDLPEKLQWELFLYQESLAAGLTYRDFDLLRRIAKAESGFRQYDDKNGEVLRGKINKHDIGIFQINILYHPELPVWTAKGNIGSAILLYKRAGSMPWQWSKSVWNIKK